MTTKEPNLNHPIGTLRRQDGAGVVHMEDRFNTDADDLWEALTEPSRLARWIAQVRGDLRIGGLFEAAFTSGWEGDGRVDVCEPPNRLLLTMCPGTEEQTVIEARILPDGGNVRLIIEERGLPLDGYASYGAGWQAHIEDLEAHLSDRSSGEWRTRWTELIPLYRAQAESEA